MNFAEDHQNKSRGVAEDIGNVVKLGCRRWTQDATGGFVTSKSLCKLCVRTRWRTNQLHGRELEQVYESDSLGTRLTPCRYIAMPTVLIFSSK